MKKVIGYCCITLLLFGASAFLFPAHAQSSGPQFCLDGNGIETAIGCVPTNPSAFVGTLFQLAIGIGGGVAFLMLVVGGMQIQLSTGNPERVNQGKEIIEGAIVGLLLIIFSIFILRVVGVDILGIPGFK